MVYQVSRSAKLCALIIISTVFKRDEHYSHEIGPRYLK